MQSAELKGEIDRQQNRRADGVEKSFDGDHFCSSDFPSGLSGLGGINSGSGPGSTARKCSPAGKPSRIAPNFRAAETTP